MYVLWRADQDLGLWQGSCLNKACVTTRDWEVLTVDKV